MPKVILMGIYLNVLLIVPVLGQHCSNDSLTEDEVVSLSTNCTKSLCTLSNRRGVNYFFPPLTFTCNGTLVNWTIAGSLVYGEVSTNPTLVIWRESTKDKNKYEIHQKTSLTYCNGQRMEAIHPQVYTCELQVGLTVQENDVVGIEVPYSASQSDNFDPYFDMQSENQPAVHYIRGTSISSFVLSESIPTNNLPLLSVGVTPIDTTEPIPESASSNPTSSAAKATHYEPARSTTGTNRANRNIVLTLEQKVGIALSGVFILIAFILLVGIQCCVIIKIKRNRRQKIINTAEPYAMVDMSGMVMSLSSMNTSQNTSEVPNHHIPISRNQSYVTTTTMSTPVTEYMYVSSEDIRIRDGSYTAEEMERHRNKQQNSYALRLSPMTANRSIGNHSSHQLSSPSSSEGNVTLAGQGQQSDEADSGIQVYRQDPTTEPIYSNGSEHIYY